MWKRVELKDLVGAEVKCGPRTAYVPHDLLVKNDYAGNVALVLGLSRNGRYSLFYLVPEFECCSDSWIESVQDDGVEGRTVESISVGEPVDLGDWDPWSRPYLCVRKDNTSLQCYDISIIAGSRRLRIELRNASNGYYGGDISAWEEVV